VKGIITMKDFSRLMKTFRPCFGADRHDTFLKDFIRNVSKENSKCPFDGLKEDTLKRYVNGNRDLTQKRARMILSCYDRDRFETYILSLDYPLQDSLILKIKTEFGYKYNRPTLAKGCANLFEEILYGYITGSKTDIS
jgi:hypothetical protein